MLKKSKKKLVEFVNCGAYFEVGFLIGFVLCVSIYVIEMKTDSQVAFYKLNLFHHERNY